MQIYSEIYSYISGKDLEPFKKLILDQYPKSKGQLSRLKHDELIRITELTKELYRDINAEIKTEALPGCSD